MGNRATDLVTTQEIQAIHEQLSQAIGEENTGFDAISRLLYSTDASNYEIVPVGVTFPRHADDVSAIHEICRQFEIPLLPRGGGTSLSGQAVGRAVIIDFTRHMRRIRSIHAEMPATVQVEPGLVLEQLNTHLQKLNLMFGPDPASANRATLGGCLGNNASGAHSILYGMTADHVRWVDVVLASGEKVRLGNKSSTIWNTTTHNLRTAIEEILRRYAAQIATNYPHTWRTVAGYALNRLRAEDIDLAQLIIGSEGTLGSIVQAELALVPCPRMTRLAILHFDDLIHALELVPVILETDPSAVELLDALLLNRTRQHPEFARKMTFIEGNPSAVLIVEFYGESAAELDARIAILKKRLQQENERPFLTEQITPAQQSQVWSVRKAGLGLLASNRSDWKTLALIEDAAVPVQDLPAYVRAILAIVQAAGAEVSIYAHASAGCLHIRPLLNLKTDEGLRQYRAIAEAAVEAVLSFHGTIAGEHGQGYLRSEFTARMFGQDLYQAFCSIKDLFDPLHLLNPHKIVYPMPMDTPALLRYTPAYATPLTLTTTRYNWDDDNGFSGAVEMCNGAGVCRKEDKATMCPSFMATREEKDSTRGRANILRLAMTGALGLEGMHSIEVKQVLDLCLSCKACKAECPSAVDMARLKAEFIAHYQDHHGIPLRSRLFANIHRFNAFGSHFPRLANLALNAPLISGLTKKAMGIAPQRRLPALAAQSFSDWWKENAFSFPDSGTNQAPILIMDTFTEYNHPHIGKALIYLAKQGKINVSVMRLPNGGCCGRPAMSKGLLDQAKRMMNANIRALSALVRDDIRFMMLEPSCVSAFSDDAEGLVDPAWRSAAADIARRVISVETWLWEWRQSGGMDNLTWDLRPRKVMLHGHCHEKTLWGTTAALGLLRSIPGAQVQELDAGCCGMAGSFGYEQEHYEISLKIAHKRLGEGIRNHPQTIFAASGTSCRDQIEHLAGYTRHPVEILAEACGWRR